MSTNNAFSQIPIYSRIHDYLLFSDRLEFIRTCKEVYKVSRPTYFRTIKSGGSPKEMIFLIESNPENDPKIDNFFKMAEFCCENCKDFGKIPHNEILRFYNSIMFQIFQDRNEIFMFCGKFNFHLKSKDYIVDEYDSNYDNMLSKAISDLEPYIIWNTTLCQRVCQRSLKLL